MANEDPRAEIAKESAENKLVIGTNSVMRCLKTGKLKKVYLSSNCALHQKNDIKHYAEIENVPVVELPYPNDELSVICKKQFSISALGLRR